MQKLNKILTYINSIFIGLVFKLGLHSSIGDKFSEKTKLPLLLSIMLFLGFGTILFVIFYSISRKIIN